MSSLCTYYLYCTYCFIILLSSLPRMLFIFLLLFLFDLFFFLFYCILVTVYPLYTFAAAALDFPIMGLVKH